MKDVSTLGSIYQDMFLSTWEDSVGNLVLFQSRQNKILGERFYDWPLFFSLKSKVYLKTSSPEEVKLINKCNNNSNSLHSMQT